MNFLQEMSTSLRKTMVFGQSRIFPSGNSSFLQEIAFNCKVSPFPSGNYNFLPGFTNRFKYCARFWDFLKENSKFLKEI